MQIHISRDGEQFGPYPLEQVNEYLAAGNLLPTDQAWYEGAPGWMPLPAVEGVNAPVFAPAASRMEGMAVGALVLGVLGLLTGGATKWVGLVLLIITCAFGVVGLVLGVIGLVRIKNGNGDRHGKGLAIAGAVLSPLAVVLAVMMNSSSGAISNTDSANKNGGANKGGASGKGSGTSAASGLSERPTKVERVKCVNNVAQIGKSLLGFAYDNEERYPWLLMPRDEQALGNGKAGWSRETSTLFAQSAIRANFGSASILVSPLDPDRQPMNDQIDLNNVNLRENPMSNDAHSYGVACGSVKNGNAADVNRPGTILVVTRNINGPLNNGDSLSDQEDNPRASTAKKFAIWKGADKHPFDKRTMAGLNANAGQMCLSDGSARLSNNSDLAARAKAHHNELGGSYRGSPSGIIDTPND